MKKRLTYLVLIFIGISFLQMNIFAEPAAEIMRKSNTIDSIENSWKYTTKWLELEDTCNNKSLPRKEILNNSLYMIKFSWNVAAKKLCVFHHAKLAVCLHAKCTGFFSKFMQKFISLIQKHCSLFRISVFSAVRQIARLHPV